MGRAADLAWSHLGWSHLGWSHLAWSHLADSSAARQVNRCDGAHAAPAVSFESEQIGVRCMTASHCEENTTLCTYSRGAHFNTRGVFGESFPLEMTHEIVRFFSAHACAAGLGSACHALLHLERQPNPAGIRCVCFAFSSFGIGAS